MNRKVRPSVLSANSLFMLSIIISNIVFGLLYFIPGIIKHKDEIWFNYALLIVNESIFIFGIAYFYLAITKKDVAVVTRLHKGIDWGQGILIFAIFIFSTFAISPLNDLWYRFLELIGYKIQDIGIPNPNTAPMLLLGVASIGIAPAFCEEFMYRGVIMRGYENYNKVMAIIMSSLLFGLMHATLEQLAFAVLMGAIMGTLVCVTDSLWASILFHFLNNFRSIILIFLINKFDINLDSDVVLGGFEIGTYLVISIPLVVVLIYCLSLISKKRYHTAVAAPKNAKGILAYIPFTFGFLFILLAYYLAYTGAK